MCQKGLSSPTLPKTFGPIQKRPMLPSVFKICGIQGYTRYMYISWPFLQGGSKYTFDPFRPLYQMQMWEWHALPNCAMRTSDLPKPLVPNPYAKASTRSMLPNLFFKWAWLDWGWWGRGWGPARCQSPYSQRMYFEKWTKIQVWI